MKNIGLYGFLFKNSISKTTWKQYGFEDFYEQTNMIFVVLLFIMEQSLKDEPCTMDDIGGFIDMVNMRSFKKELSYEDSRELGDFIVNVILGNQGKTMYFKAYDFREDYYKNIHISFINNKPIYLEGDVRRTSYYLTEDGYNLMLSSLEMESNMLLTIHEMIFKLHIEKASYDKAVDDVKNIFNQLHIQFQNIKESMKRIKQNALNYSVVDYKRLLEDNLDIIENTSKKFSAYRDHIRDRVLELEEKNINIQKLDKKDLENLKNLRVIESYLGHVIDEHQQILKGHFELKSLYSKELEDLSQMTLIKRFDFRRELFDKILEDVSNLENIEYFIRPLLSQKLEKTYNINKSIEIQKPIRTKAKVEDEEIFIFDEEKWAEEQKKLKEEKLSLYNASLRLILLYGSESGEITLAEIKEKLNGDYVELIPNVEIFKEVMIELMRNTNINIDNLKKERLHHIEDNTSLDFQLNESILDLLKSSNKLSHIREINILKMEGENLVSFENVASSTGKLKNIHCSNVYFEFK